METLFKVILGHNKAEFSVIAIPNVAKNTLVFQGLLNGVPFTEGLDYQKIRSRVHSAIELNQPQNREEMS